MPRKNSNAKPVIVFDCDGVLLDSNEMKQAAFRAVLADYEPRAAESFFAYQSSSFGRSRFRLIEDFFVDFLKRDPIPGEVDGLIAEFGVFTSREYLNVPETPGLRQVLLQLAPLYDFAIASGSAQQELREVLAARGLDTFFFDIFGSPVKKEEIIAQIGGTRTIVAMVGDAAADFHAAQKSNVPFVYMSRYSTAPEQMQALQDEYAFPEIDTLEGLPLLLHSSVEQ